MEEHQLLAIVEHEIENASGANDETLSNTRAEALNYYMGEATGKLEAKPGKSAVVDQVLADAVEWALPQLLETFVGGEEVLRFDHDSTADEEQAKNETDAVNYVVTKQNNPYLIWNTAFRDALLHKNCVIETYWDDTKHVSQETYNGLNGLEFQQLLDDPQVEILEQEEIPNEQIQQQIIQLQMTGQQPDPAMMLASMTYNVRLMRTEPGIVINPIPLDNFHYSRDTNSLDFSKSRMVGFDSLRSVSDLIEDGFDKDLVYELPSYEEEDDEEDYAREQGEWWGEEDGSSDPSQRMIRVYKIYLRVDMNEDGVGELYEIYYAGKKILRKTEADSCPFTCGSGIPQGHTFEGRSFHDRLKELMEQKTATWRQVLDNMYQVNNVRHVVLTGKVNMDDMLSNRTGGVIRAKGVNTPLEAVAPLPVQPMFQHGYQMLDYMDKMAEGRTGVGPNHAAQANALSGDTAHGLERIMSAGEMLIGNIKRALAETIVKSTYLKVRELLVKHQDQPMTVPGNGDDLVVEPSTWKKRDKTTIKVGLGTGDRMKQMAAMQQVIMFQEKLAMGGRDDMITPQKVYNALEDFGSFAGLPGVDQYFVDPSSKEGQEIAQQKAQQPPAPDPNMMLLEVENKKAEGQLMKAQADAQSKQADQQLKMQEMQQKEQEMQLKVRELDLQMQELALKEMQVSGSFEMDRYKVDSDTAIEQAKLEQNREGQIIELQKERDRLQAELMQQRQDYERASADSETSAGAGGSAQPIPEIHIHNGGRKRVVVNRTANGLEGTSESVDEE